MIRSFRLRLALLSALLAGLVLAAFGLGSLWLIRNIKTEKIDNELRFFAERQAARPRDPDGWPFAEGELAIRLGVRDRTDLLLLVQTPSGETLFQSAHWPADLRTDKINWPKPGDGPGQRSLNRPLGMVFIASAQAATVSEYAPVQLAAGGPGGGGPGGGPGGRGSPGGPGGPGGPPGPTGPAPGAPAVAPPGALPGPSRSTDRPEPAPYRPLPLEQTDQVATPEMRLPPPSAAQVNTPMHSVAGPLANNTAPDARPPQHVDRPPPLVLEPLPPLPTDRPPPASAVQALFAAADQQWRFGLSAADNVRVAIAINASVMDSDMRGTRIAFLLALPFALVLIGAGSWVFAGRALRPLQKLTAVTQRVTAEGLSQRILARGEDLEFAGLIEVFNNMLARLERSFQQARRFSADAAHELKTPLAIVQGQLERAIAQAEDGSNMQGNLTSILDEVQRLSTISRKLLLLSQADAGKLYVSGTPFDMSSALEDLLEDTRMLAPQLQVNANIEAQLFVQGDASLLRQVLHNLISNAIKYNAPPDGVRGWIRIDAQRRVKGIEVVVSNSSEGIAAALREKIFERFFRVDSAHSRSVEGVGLGLSVSREIARAHGGDLTLQGVDAGAVYFALHLPLQRPTINRWGGRAMQ